MARNVVGVLPGEDAQGRVLIVVDQPKPGQATRVLLIEQNHAEGIGWFDQRTMSLSTTQWKQMRGLFGSLDSRLDDIPEPPPATIRIASFFEEPEPALDAVG